MQSAFRLQAFSVLLLFAFTTWAELYQSWSAGTLELVAPATFGPFNGGGGTTMHFNNDGNLVVLSGTTVAWQSGKTTPDCNGACRMVFQHDGNFVTYYGSQPLFNTSTTGRGATLYAMSFPPYFWIYSAAGDLIWYPDSLFPQQSAAVP